ncbi:MAG: efflux RND transporter permease subunit [Planctomycetota bacterium]|nr:efflux RND transporter permease subunit [Planctomycetota bacterium]
MRGAIDWFARNRVAANLLMLLLIVGGVLAGTFNKIELFPEFSLDMVQVRVDYPGAAPEEVEESICVPIEEAVHNLEGVKRLRSTAAEGSGSVLIEVQGGFDPRELLEDVKTRVDAIDTFPEESEKPVIEDMLMRGQVINVAVYGPADEAVLKRLGERVREELNMLPDITQVELVNVRPYEISIEVSEEAMRRHGITFDEVANAVRGSSLDLSGGSVKTERGEILLRTKGRAYQGPEFERIVLMTRPDGTRILLGDVAEVVDGFEDVDRESRFDGQPSVMVQVFRVGDESALAISRTVHEYVAEAQRRMPEGIELQVWQDAAQMLQSRLDLMIRNGAQGLMLVFLVLALFLRFRLSFWVTLGIPTSFLGALLLLPMIDVSINLLSLFAFILVLGIVVDDAIIVGESVSKEHERGDTGVEAAIRGTHEVAVPVTFAVLTSVIAFLPLLALPGMMGKFFRVIPMVVIPCLLFSLVESKLILPAHLAHQSKALTNLAQVAPFRWWVAFQSLFSRGLQACVQHVYRPLLERGLRWRYLTLALAIATLLLTAGLIGGGFVKFVFFNDIEGDVVSVRLTMPLGTSARVTAHGVEQLETAAEELRVEIEQEHGLIFRGSMASVGEQPYARAKAARFGDGGRFGGPHLGEVTIELIPSEEREVTANEVVRRWRELCGQVPGAVELAFDSSVMSAGDPVNVELSATDVNQLRAAAAEVKLALAGLEGVFDITDSYRGGKEELVLDIDPSAEALGLNRRDLARQVRQGFYGEEAQRIQRGRDEIKVMVRYPRQDRRTLHVLETMRIRTPMGDEIPFSTVATVDVRRGYASIQRTDRRRTVNVTADVDTAVANANEIQGLLARDVLPGVVSRHPGVSTSFEGQSREQEEMMGAMMKYSLFALLGIYGIMAIPFRSYLQPLIVMSAIPFGLVGAVLGHIIMDVEFSALSMCGIVALAGVVVNDSLVLVDFVNRNRAKGMSASEAARRASIERFRPILLTSLTTFAGLTPLLLEKSVQAQFLIPMAVSLAFGVLFSTFISLVLVPVGYLILEDMRRLGGRLASCLRWLYGPRRPAGEADSLPL